MEMIDVALKYDENSIKILEGLDAFPMRPLNWKSPADYLKAFLINGEVF